MTHKCIAEGHTINKPIAACVERKNGSFQFWLYEKDNQVVHTFIVKYCPFCGVKSNYDT